MRASLKFVSRFQNESGLATDEGEQWSRYYFEVYESAS